MYSIAKSFSFCYGHRLLDDASKCRHLHGHTGRATVVLTTRKLDDRGMVAHFDELKRTVGTWIEKEIDHTMLLFESDPMFEAMRRANEKVIALPFHPTAENLARMIFEKVRSFGFPVVRVELWESETAKASYEEGST